MKRKRSVRSSPTRLSRQATRDHGALLLMLTPYLIGTTVLVVVPALLAMIIAFTRYDTLGSPEWVGLGNFESLASNSLFSVAARNSLVFVLLAVPLRILGALALALLLRAPRPGIGLLRMAVFFPTVIPDVAYALIWLWIFNPIYGPLNLALKALGLPVSPWLAEGNTALLAIVIMAAFQIGEGFVVLLAGLQNVPEEYYQIAALEGGNRWQQFRFITLPLLAPWLLLLTLRDIILSAQNTFTPAFLMTGGGPYYATLFLPLLMYQEAFDAFRFGSAAAMMLLLLLGVGLLLGLVYLVVRGWGYSDEQ
ncbi:carbohydrate ABC transporter permease [Calidithermus timidus]|jgi:multiple sugar transport system permease protein|uniref:carbohydrate ABC transporter permease n=1 Tax=Calidithermus timidus TaxID=307124 RepID=UPI0003681324|nr:sugar ABC transporter permease [Calidithermus timidus]